MNRPVVIVVVVLVSVVLLSGTLATVAAFTGGDEVVEGSEVYFDAADSDNGEQYVRLNENNEVRLQFDNLPPGSQTRVEDLFVVGFGGYEDSDDATTVRLESADDRLTLIRMDTGESFGEGTVELDPGESVLFGAIVSTDVQHFSSAIELEVDVPDTDGGGGGGGGTGGVGGGAGDADGDDPVDDPDDGDGDTPEEASDSDEAEREPDDGDGDTPEEATDSDEVEGEPDEDDTAEGDDATDPGGGLIELAGFGSPISLIAVGVLAVILSLSYAFRLELIAGSLTGNTGGSE